jgi:hypothetical protein
VWVMRYVLPAGKTGPMWRKTSPRDAGFLAEAEALRSRCRCAAAVPVRLVSAAALGERWARPTVSPLFSSCVARPCLGTRFWDTWGVLWALADGLEG